MPFESGGIADKLGNRYEEQWVVHLLLQLLNEQIHSVTIEAIGDDERGVDLWVQYSDGTEDEQKTRGQTSKLETN